jgi:hypothetical protein
MALAEFDIAASVATVSNTDAIGWTIRTQHSGVRTVSVKREAQIGAA